MLNKIYRYYQPNDKDTKDNHSDCAIRALTKVLNKEWLATFDGLLPYARDMQCMPSDEDVMRNIYSIMDLLIKA